MDVLYFLMVCFACAVAIFLAGLIYFAPWSFEIFRLFQEIDDDIEVLLGRKTREEVRRQDLNSLLLSPVPAPPPKPQPNPGDVGITSTPLRPWGKFRIGHDCFDAKAAIGYLDAGVEVRVIEQTAAGVVVDAIDRPNLESKT